MTHAPPHRPISAAAQDLLGDIFIYAYAPPRCIARCQSCTFRFVPWPDFNWGRDEGFHSWYAHYPAQLAELAEHGLLEYTEVPVAGMEHLPPANQLVNQVYFLNDKGRLYGLRTFVQLVGTIPGPRMVAK